MTRVENLLEEGWPDVEGCLEGKSFHIELKSAKRPKRETTRVLAPDDIRPRQPPWLKARWMAGGNAFWLVQVGERHRACRYLLPGYMDIADYPEDWFATHACCQNVKAHTFVNYAANYNRWFK